MSAHWGLRWNECAPESYGPLNIGKLLLRDVRARHVTIIIMIYVRGGDELLESITFLWIVSDFCHFHGLATPLNIVCLCRLARSDRSAVVILRRWRRFVRPPSSCFNRQLVDYSVAFVLIQFSIYLKLSIIIFIIIIIGIIISITLCYIIWATISQKKKLYRLSYSSFLYGHGDDGDDD